MNATRENTVIYPLPEQGVKNITQDTTANEFKKFKYLGKSLTNEDVNELQSKVHPGDSCITSIHFRILHLLISYLKA
jgi:hypothetical protein